MTGKLNISDITIVTVSYHSLEVLRAMSRSLPSGVALVIVDNANEPDLQVWAESENHRLLNPGRNIGFGAACNMGAQACTSAYVLFLNPDCELQADTLEKLLAAAAEHPEASAFGPAFVRATGKPYKYRPSKLLKAVPKHFADPFPQSIAEKPSLSGAALMCKREAFERVSGFDEALFLYFEDDDLTMRLSRQCGPLFYVPTAKIAHIGGSSTSPSLELEKFKGFHFAFSYWYTMRKHGWSMPLLRIWLITLRRLLSLKILRKPYRWFFRGHLQGAEEAFRSSRQG